MAEVGEACGRHKTDVADPENPDRCVFVRAQPTGFSDRAIAMMVSFGMSSRRVFCTQ
jgi:hypothetical protein